MKRKNKGGKIKVIINKHGVKCDKCLHVRIDEPYAFYSHYRAGKFTHFDIVCWRCCRDAESTFMIRQRWPIAFERVSSTYGFILRWAPGVAELVGENVKS